MRFVQEAAELVSTLSGAVQREIYGGRVAEAAGITPEAMKMEVEKAYKRRAAREKKKQERIDLAPAQAMQPKSRTIRYDNVKSAAAEERVLALILREPALLEQTKGLEAEEFSSPLLGRAYEQLKSRFAQGMDVSLAVLSDFTGEEMSHLTGVLQRQTGPVSEQALADCVRIIHGEHQAANVSTADDLLALREKLKERKGIRT